MSGTLTQCAWVHVCACVCVFYSISFRCEKENNMLFPTHPITHTMHTHACVVRKEMMISVAHLCCLPSGSKHGYRTEHWASLGPNELYRCRSNSALSHIICMC